MDWKQVVIGVKVSFPGFQLRETRTVIQTTATIIGIGKKQGRLGRHTECYLRLNDGSQVTRKVSDLSSQTIGLSSGWDALLDGFTHR